MSRGTSWMLLLPISACLLPEGGQENPAPVTGAWGGRDVGLELGPLGGRLDYDCASGTIEGPLRLDSHGRFTARGRHTPGHGGPEREGYVPPSWPATYSGQVRGDEMVLRVRVEQTRIEIGPMSLRRNAEPIIFRCL